MRQQDIGLYSISDALVALRSAEPPNWELVAAICGIHLQGHIPGLQNHLRVQNVTGMMSLFFDEADRLTRELPERMADPHRPLSASEAENLATRIVLLRETAAAANAIVFPTVHHDAVVIPLRRAA